MAIIIAEIDTDLQEDVLAVIEAFQATLRLLTSQSVVYQPFPASISAAARRTAETVTLDDEEHPEYGHQPVIRDIDQLASFIDDGIRTYLGIPELGEYEPQ